MTDSVFAGGFAEELEAEAVATKNCLAAIPEDLFSWKPHPRSMEMGYLTRLVGEIPLWITHTINNPDIDFVTFEHADAKNGAEVARQFEQHVREAKARLLMVKDGELEAGFDLKSNGQVVLRSTKRESIASMINHLVHHRGQLTVYMRLNDIAVPSIYGPSADSRG